MWDPWRGDPAFQKLCEEKQPVKLLFDGMNRMNKMDFLKSEEGSGSVHFVNSVRS
jgi:hypothetical protein